MFECGTNSAKGIEPLNISNGSSTLQLTDEQEDAIGRVEDFLDEETATEFALGGYAGTGKTTLVNEILRRYGSESTVVLAPTGKAAHVLRTKGVQASTVHSFVYDFNGTFVDEETKKELPSFVAKEQLHEQPDLVVVDESSMVNGEMVRDMRTHSFPKTLWVGDHGQLPPVGSDPGLMSRLDARLETIHRQAADNPIVNLAHFVRRGNHPGDFQSPDRDRVLVGRSGTVEKMVEFANREKVDQVIVAYNRTRREFNASFRRKIRGFGLDVEVGDKLICLRNDYGRAVHNGMLFAVSRVHFVDSERSVVDLIAEDGSTRSGVPISSQLLRDGDVMSPMIPEGVLSFDYGYAITCHKAQGSEWNSVLVFDQPSRGWDMSRWRYTAFTRAKERLIVAV